VGILSLVEPVNELIIEAADLAQRVDGFATVGV
jgi:hypothetical protein